MAKLSARQGDQAAAATHITAAVGHYSECQYCSAALCVVFPIGRHVVVVVRQCEEEDGMWKAVNCGRAGRRGDFLSGHALEQG